MPSIDHAVKLCPFHGRSVTLHGLRVDLESRRVSGLTANGRRVVVPLDDVAHMHQLGNGVGRPRTYDCRPIRRRRPSEHPTSTPKTLSFTQDKLDRIIASRVAEVRSEYAALSEKAAKYDAAERGQVQE